MKTVKKGKEKTSNPPEGREIKRKMVKHDRTEDAVVLQNQLLAAISRAQACFIDNTDIKEVFDTLLSDILALTESEYGFIGEALYTTEGQPYLKTHAISNLSWNEATRTFYEQNAPKGMEFYNPKTLFGLVLATGVPVIANDPPRDPRRGGLPDGHPSLDAFLGIPIRAGDKLVAMIGIANRQGGYDKTILDFLNPLLATIGQLVEVRRHNVERKQTEEELQKTLAELTVIHQNAPIAMMLVDRDWRVEKVNEIAAFIANRSAEEMIGLRCGEALRCLHHLEDPRGCGYGPACATCAIRLAVLKAFATGQNKRDVESWLPFPNGENVREKCLLVNTAFLKVDSTERVLVCAQDITERKQAEEALKSSEERHRTLVESISDAILLLNSERRIVSCNPAFCNLYGYERDEIEGRSVRIIHRSDESYRSFGEWAYPTVIKEGSFRGEWILVHKNGTEIPVEVVLSAIQPTDGLISGYIKIMHDISVRKRAEQEMVSIQEQLRQFQKMEAIGQLAGGVAHDFNNILTVIKGVCQLSLLDLRKGDPLHANLEEIERAAARAADLTRQLLAFSRKQILEVQVLDLNQVIQKLDKILHRLLGEDIELATFFTEGLGRVKADPGQVEQAIINLSVNARDAMPKGGKLTIETSNVGLDEEYARRHIGVKPGSYVMLSISDTGAGMTQEVKERLFEPFFTTKEMGKGTGLGLSTVYGIVKQSGGNIWVYSELGQGTTFKIYLPRVDEPLEERKEEIIQEVPMGSETILVVEDEEAVRKLAVRLLKKQGYKALEAPDGGQAFIFCEKYGEPIHLILSDVVMPGMSGRELVERLQKIHPEARALYMSGYTDNVILHHGILEKGIEFIQKPFTVESLARKVREVLDK